MLYYNGQPKRCSNSSIRCKCTNAELVSATIERGQANMAMLEHGVIKDNTLMPREWYGAQLRLRPLVSDDGPTTIHSIAVLVGSDWHEFTAIQDGPQ
jgi:hypothetical protein